MNDLTKLHVYISTYPGNADLVGAIGTLSQKPGWRYAQFKTGGHVVNVTPGTDTRPLNPSDRIAQP